MFPVIEKLLANPRTMVLLAVLISVAGLSALYELPRTEDPPMLQRFAWVMTEFPGADAERVESMLSEPLERGLRTRSVVKAVDVASSFGLSVIAVELSEKLGKHDLEAAWSEVKNELDEYASRRPTGIGEPVLEKDRFQSFTIVYGLSLIDQSEENLERNTMMLSRIAKDLEGDLLSEKGTEYVNTIGDAGEEILVELDMPKVIAAGLSVAEISQRISAADTKVSAGSVSGGQHRFAIEVGGSFEDLERLRRIPVVVAERGVLLLGDLAEVSRAPVTPAKAYAFINGKRGLAVGARMSGDMRSDRWTKKIMQRMEAYQKTLPKNVALELIFNQDDYTSERLGNLVINVLIGFSLILCVLLFSLGWRAALIVASSLPLTVLFALVAMNVLDRTIDQMSVTGLIIALGIMVDNAIVMTDTVARYRMLGLSAVEAQLKSVRRLWVPLMGSTLTTVFAFMPMVMVPGAVGEFVSGIGVSVIFSLIGSFLISQVIVSGLAARFLTIDYSRESAGERKGSWIQNGLQLQKMGRLLRSAILKVLKRPLFAGVMLVIPSFFGFYSAGKLPTEFFPASDRDMINLEIYLPVSHNASATRNIVERVDDLIRGDEEIISLHWFVGSDAPKVYYNLLFNGDGAPNYAQAMMKLKNFHIANRKVSELQDLLDENIPEAQFIVRRFQQGPPFAPIAVRVIGDNVDLLASIGEQVKSRLLSLPGVTHAQTSVSQGEPKALIAADEGILQSIGLALSDTASQTLAATDGLVQAQLLEDTQTIPVRVRASYYKEDTGLLLPDIPLQGRREGDGRLFGTPLSSLANVNYIPVRNTITRRDGERLNTVSAYLRDGVLPSEVIKEFKRRMENNPIILPDGYSIEYGGEAEESGEAIGNLFGTLGVIMVLMMTSIVMAFGSFRLTILILFVAGLSAGLGMLALFISGFPFGFTSVLGIMAMIGLAINAAIVILAECRANAQACLGDHEAIVHSVMHCARHITSTTITTIMGFLPLLVAGGGFWPPFAIVVAGGTLLTTSLSMFMVPLLFAKLASIRSFSVAH